MNEFEKRIIKIRTAIDTIGKKSETELLIIRLVNAIKQYDLGLITNGEYDIALVGIEGRLKDMLEFVNTNHPEISSEEINAAALQWVRQNQGDARAFDAGARWAIEYMKSKTQ